MVTATQILTVNAPFLREIKDDNRRLADLLVALRALTGNSVLLRNHWHRLVDLLARLCDQLALHFALEEAYGYFEDEFDVPPHLAERAEALQAERTDLFGSIRHIAEEAEEWRARRGSPHRLFLMARRFRHFDAELQNHEAAENALILEALQDDIGVGD
jgi:hypothetical protein